MSKKRREDEPTGLDRVLALMDEAPPGLHDIEPPAPNLPSGLPAPLIELYARCDGARLYLDTVELVRSADVVQDEAGRWKFGTIDGETVSLDARGRVWRADNSLEDDVVEGTRLERWLAGVFDAVGLLYDGDGEFAEDVFDEDGEIEDAVVERQLRAQLKRDAAAPGPRWRLAQLLLAGGDAAAARKQLEQVVADSPELAWAWLDLARISERSGELANAQEEARAAATAAAGHGQEGYFWAQLARLAAKAGDEATRATAAATAARLAPDLKAQQLAGARASLASDDPDAESARGLVELLRAVWPRDLEVLALAGTLEKREN